MPSSRTDWDDDDVDAFSSSSRSSTSWIASEDMASEDNLNFFWNGVEVSVSVSISEANGGSDGSGTVWEESDWGDEVLVEENLDFDESLEIGVGMVENDVNVVDQVVEGGDGFDLNLDSVEELVQEDVGEEADWVDERVFPVSFRDFVEEECDLGESLEFVQELEGSGAEQDHMTVMVDFGEILGVDGNSLANSSDEVNNSNLVTDFDFADSLGISGDGMEEGHTSEESSDFEDNTPTEGEINLEDNNPSSDGFSWGFVDSLRGVSRDDMILGDYVVFGELDNEGSERIFDQIMRSDIRRRRAASSAASKDVVERLPVMEVKEGMFKGSDSDGACAVCKNNVQVGERVRRLPCLHYFHEECIIPWLEIRNTCPLCRHELPTEDAGNEGIRRRRRVDSGSQEGGSSPNQPL